MDFLLSGIMDITWQQCIMYVIGVVLIWLAIGKGLEPSLLLPMGLGAILVNIPDTGVLGHEGIIEWLFETGINAAEALPILLFIGIGAMIDFGPLLSNPKMFLFGAAAQFGIFATIRRRFQVMFTKLYRMVLALVEHYLLYLELQVTPQIMIHTYKK